MFTKKPEIKKMDDGSLVIKTFGSADANCYSCQKRMRRAKATLTDGSLSFALDQRVRNVSIFDMRLLQFNVYLHRFKLVIVSSFYFIELFESF